GGPSQVAMTFSTGDYLPISDNELRRQLGASEGSKRTVEAVLGVNTQWDTDPEAIAAGLPDIDSVVVRSEEGSTTVPSTSSAGGSREWRGGGGSGMDSIRAARSSVPEDARGLFDEAFSSLVEANELYTEFRKL